MECTALVLQVTPVVFMENACNKKTYLNKKILHFLPGFTGVKCETNINHCHASGSDDEHFCLNGTPCSTEDPNLQGATKKYGCNCNGSNGARDEITQMLAGRFCEYAVTEFCFEDNVRGDSHSFCTNGGKCKTRNKYGDNK